MKILLVDDDSQKAKDVSKALVSSGVPDEACIDLATNVADALRLLEANSYDLLILDLALPFSKTGEVELSGGRNLLRRLSIEEKYRKPDHIVGLTSVPEAYSDSAAEFGGALWAIARFDRSSNDWIAQIASRIRHILAKQSARDLGTTYDFDVAVLCALERPELKAVLNTCRGLEEVKDPSDPTRYRAGSLLMKNGGSKRIVVCSSPRMGMAHAAAMTAKICLKYRPRILLMTGICAGREGEINIGDVVVANPTWDYGSGKFSNQKSGSKFEPDPHQIPLDGMLRKSAESVAEDEDFLDKVRRDYSGVKPETALRAKVSPMASGAAVRADDGFFEALAKNNRKVVAIDMEAYGVLAAASEMPEPKTKVMIVKGVSDFANSTKEDRYQDYAAHVSVAFAFEAISRA